MKKVIFVFALFMSMLSTANAGYVIRGVPINVPPYYYNDLRNYTLTFKDGAPIAAASMHSPSVLGTGKNTIVVIQENSPIAYLFPISAPFDAAPSDIEVRDFHYDQSNNVYVLCGSRWSISGTYAFVAVIDATFLFMQFREYPETDMFYSIGDPNIQTPVPGNYYLCGTRGEFGVIASVNRGTLAPTNYYRTDIAWEYHKIIVKPTGAGAPTPLTPIFVTSGRNPECTHIGFTTLNLSLTPINSYRWEQATDLNSHCVVSDDIGVSNAVILASSYRNTVTLNPVTYPMPAAVQVHEVRFRLPGGLYFIQDIGTSKLLNNTTRISVAGFKITAAAPIHRVAWHGYVDGLFTPPQMRNNDYHSVPISNLYEHYKIRYQGGNEYTGGSFRDANRMGVLFGDPLTSADHCDNHYQSDDPYADHTSHFPFTLSLGSMSYIFHIPYNMTVGDMEFEYTCDFKGETSAPKSVTSVESEIATSHDRITLKDVPANTGYQIYTIQGQLVQTGTTTPDISTALLSKGVYILRLESGKTFKFVK